MAARFVHVRAAGESQGGRARTPFPLNVECDTPANAQACLKLLQPIANDCQGAMGTSIVSALTASPQWQEVTTFMNSLSPVFYAVSLGKHVGIFIYHDGASESLSLSRKERFRHCERFGTFHGAYAYMATNNTDIDYLGEGLGDHDGRRAPVPPPYTPSTPERATFFAATLSPGNAEAGTPVPFTPTRTVGGKTVQEHQTLSPVPPVRLFQGASPLVAVAASPLGPNGRAPPMIVPHGLPPAPPAFAVLPRDDVQISQAAADIGYIYGPWFRLYLRTHAYRPAQQLLIHQFFEAAESVEQYIDLLLGPVGIHLTEGEARFLYALMSLRPGAEDSLTI
ncbi:hypothetical protein H0H92_000328 [Tricholoma furcatifolium]|nr:hypothetical protein H0H92_000328 [Tricholoma furcatifolium]